MRKFFVLSAFICFITISSYSQKSTDTVPAPAPKTKKDWSKVSLGDRPNDHFMIQVGYDNWTGKPDSLQTKGLSRHFNMYVMYDIPFKTDPRLSVAIGAGIGSSGIFFEKTNLDIVGKKNRGIASFDSAVGNYYKKTKLSTTYAEAPIELRFVQNPLASGKSFKMAVGVKIGTLLDAHTKGKNLQTQSGGSVYGAKYVEKEKSKIYFNNTRLATTLRVGYGPVTIYGAYQINNFFKEGLGPNVRPYSIGLCIAGL